MIRLFLSFSRVATVPLVYFIFIFFLNFFEGLYFTKKNFIWKTSILKTRTCVLVTQRSIRCFNLIIICISVLRLTTNFDLWVEIFCVPTCFHVRIPKPCLSVCPYPEKRNQTHVCVFRHGVRHLRLAMQFQTCRTPFSDFTSLSGSQKKKKKKKYRWHSLQCGWVHRKGGSRSTLFSSDQDWSPQSSEHVVRG